MAASWPEISALVVAGFLFWILPNPGFRPNENKHIWIVGCPAAVRYACYIFNRASSAPAYEAKGYLGLSMRGFLSTDDDRCSFAMTESGICVSSQRSCQPVS